MADQQLKTTGEQPQTSPNHRGHPLPRRTSPGNSVTLRHHRLARDASLKAQGLSTKLGVAEPSASNPPRRNSSGDSAETRQSDAKHWFNRSNQNPTATYDDPSNMDVDPPFFQNETDSSNEIDYSGLPINAFGQGDRVPPRLRPAVTQSSSADDYRSVIDDLTIENKRLKEELKRYKQFGPDMMKKEKLFEIKVHGLPGRKKRELEATLRDFAASLGDSSESTSQRRNPGRHLQRFYSGESLSKHASSSSSNSRPVDSAYASMSTAGQSSAAPQSSVGGPSMHKRTSFGSRTKSSNQKVERYLEDTPGGLLPRRTVMTDKEKKKLVVRRLEQLFTGKISGRKNCPNQSLNALEPPPLTGDSAFLIPSLNPEASREARIQQNDMSNNKYRLGDYVSTGEQSGSGTGHGTGDSGTGSGSNITPPTVDEQRPTRPRDLDPDRVQLPSENMDYIRHLGLVPPEFLVDKKTRRHDVSADADGWVYLNLLCNLAQLHMFNVTPAFIRAAVSEKSTKFQLSPDGRKIRWRGGTDGTKFSSDSSGDSPSKSPSNDAEETDGSNETGSRKKLRTNSGVALTTSGAASSRDSRLGLVSGSSSGFHYKPLFVRHTSSAELSTDTSSQESYVGPDDEMGNGSRWDASGSGAPQRKRRHDGAIIFYSGGAPFCTDLSGDRGDLSSRTYMTSQTGQSRDLDLRAFQPVPTRTLSGSSLVIRPLSDDRAIVAEALDMDLDNPPDLVTDGGDSPSYSEFEFPWAENPEKVEMPRFPLQPRLEPCGLGGVVPEDHFAVFCQTRHPVLKNRASKGSLGILRAHSEELTESIAGRLAGLSTASPSPAKDQKEMPVDMTYISGRMCRMPPVPLPPPAMFIPPFSTDSETGTWDEELDSEEEYDEDLGNSSDNVVPRLAGPHLSDGNKFVHPYTDRSRSVGDQHNQDEDEDDVDDYKGATVVPNLEGAKADTVSSVATAGGEESGYSSSMEDNIHNTT
ncbi:hypothetical protein DL546_000418 [Coniochaeta pulveracea]|uniref:Frequency clock protein n=1 Tax=Coniochaeta pulveracea TaxID=177199 RepID=A0A420XZS9_9PEZI|nr:hypothetical protein DL546_000418 [Coniochaeta pulveracea]